MKRFHHTRRAGFALAELMVSMTVLLIAGGASLASISAFSGLSNSSQQTVQAWTGIHQMVEQLHAEDFHDIFATYDTDPSNDPDGPGTAPGGGFAIPGLDVQRNDLDNFVGQITFPVDTATPGVLLETHVDAAFGMPRDLSGDGTIDGSNHASDYAVLPARLNVSWRGRTGNREIELQVLLLR